MLHYALSVLAQQHNMIGIGMKIISLLFGLVILISVGSSFSLPLNTRQRRSPQNDNPWCQTAFLNFARFSPRMCPKPPLCKLSRPLASRRCT